MSSDQFATFVADAAPPAESRGVRGEEMWWVQGDWHAVAPVAGVPVTESTALRLSPILAAVNVLATDVAVMPLKLYRKSGDRRERVDGHPVARLFDLTPDGETTPLNWRQAINGHALLWGTGYAEVVRNGRGQAIRMHLLEPDQVRKERQGKRLGWRLNNGRWLAHENVFRLAGFGFDGLVGHNFVRLAEVAISLGLAAQGFAADFFGNGADPGGVIEHPRTLTDTALKHLRESFESRHRGPGKRHTVGILEEGAKFNPSGGDPARSQLVETRKFQVVDATRQWRVPPNKLGDLSESHYANIEASNLDYYQTALLQWLEAWEQEARLKLLTPAENAAGYYLEHDAGQLLRGDIKSRFEAYRMALTDGWMSRDEVRARENLDPIGPAGGGRKHLVQINQTTLERIGEEPATLPPAPPAAPPASAEPPDPDTETQGEKA